jgi:hypothetical protein
VTLLIEVKLRHHPLDRCIHWIAPWRAKHIPIRFFRTHSLNDRRDNHPVSYSRKLFSKAIRQLGVAQPFLFHGVLLSNGLGVAERLQRKSSPDPAAQFPEQHMNTRITSEQAEELAKKAVGEYLSNCKLQDASQIGDVLMKLVSVAGVVMAQAEGSRAAADRLVGTAVFFANNMPAEPATLRPVQ